MKVKPIHTDTVYSHHPEASKFVFHDEDQCQYYKEIVRDGNAIPGEGTNRRRCKECQKLAK